MKRKIITYAIIIIMAIIIWKMIGIIGVGIGIGLGIIIKILGVSGGLS